MQLVTFSLPECFVGAGVFVKSIPALDHFNAQSHVLRRSHLDRQAEAVQQLRAQFTFFRVATADQDKSGRVANAQTFTLHQVFTGGGNVNQQIDQRVVQQIHLVDVQKPPVGLGQQAG